MSGGCYLCPGRRASVNAAKGDLYAAARRAHKNTRALDEIPALKAEVARQQQMLDEHLAEFHS